MLRVTKTYERLGRSERERERERKVEKEEHTYIRRSDALSSLPAHAYTTHEQKLRFDNSLETHSKHKQQLISTE